MGSRLFTRCSHRAKWTGHWESSHFLSEAGLLCFMIICCTQGHWALSLQANWGRCIKPVPNKPDMIGRMVFFVFASVLLDLSCELCGADSCTHYHRDIWQPHWHVCPADLALGSNTGYLCTFRLSWLCWADFKVFTCTGQIWLVGAHMVIVGIILARLASTRLCRLFSSSCIFLFSGCILLIGKSCFPYICWGHHIFGVLWECYSMAGVFLPSLETTIMTSWTEAQTWEHLPNLVCVYIFIYLYIYHPDLWWYTLPYLVDHYILYSFIPHMAFLATWDWGKFPSHYELYLQLCFYWHLPDGAYVSRCVAPCCSNQGDHACMEPTHIRIHDSSYMVVAYYCTLQTHTVNYIHDTLHGSCPARIRARTVDLFANYVQLGTLVHYHLLVQVTESLMPLRMTPEFLWFTWECVFWLCITDYCDDTTCCHMADDLPCTLRFMASLHNLCKSCKWHVLLWWDLLRFCAWQPWPLLTRFQIIGTCCSHICLLSLNYEGCACLSLYCERLCWIICSTVFCNVL